MMGLYNNQICMGYMIKRRKGRSQRRCLSMRSREEGKMIIIKIRSSLKSLSIGSKRIIEVVLIKLSCGIMVKEMLEFMQPNPSTTSNGKTKSCLSQTTLSSTGKQYPSPIYLSKFSKLRTS